MSWIRKCLQLWMELILFAPVVIMAGVLAFPESQRLLWFSLLAAGSIAGLFVRGVLRLRRNWILLPIGVVWTVGVVELTAGWTQSSMFASFGQWLIAIVATCLFALVIFYRGTLIVSRTWEDMFPVQFRWFGLIAYFFGYFFFRYTDQLEPFLPWVYWLGLFCLGFVLWNSNALFLREASHSRGNQPNLSRSVRRMNRTMIVLSYILILVLGSFQQIKDMLEHWIRVLWGLLPRGEEQEEPMPEPPPAPDIQLGDGIEPTEPSIFWRILELVFYWAVGLALAVGLIGLLIYAMPRLGRGLFKLMERFFAFLKRSNEDLDQSTSYIDEESKLGGWKEWRKAMQNRIAQWRQRKDKKEPKWSDLTNNRERVRFLYRRLLARTVALGYVFKPQLTPQETIEDMIRWHTHQANQLKKRDRDGDSRESRISHSKLRLSSDATEWAKLYNRGRYSDEELPDELIQRWKNETDKS